MISDTFQLVHSLSKSEKRYFQRWAGLHTIGEKNNYLKLFEALAKQKQFNEEEIRSTFRGRHLSLLKRHLYKSILRSIRAFHENSSISIQVQSMTSEAEILYKKGLIKAALKLVLHAKKTAARHELDLALAQLLELEIRILSSTHQLDQSQVQIERAFKEAGRQIDRYSNFLQCFQFRMDVSAIHNKEILFRQAAEQKKYSEEIKILSAKDLSEKAQWQLFNAAGTLYSAMGNHQRGQVYHKKAASISEKKTSPLGDELRQYLLSLYTRGITDFYLKNYESALNSVEHLRTVFSTLSGSAHNKNIRELYLHSLLLEGFVHMDTNAFDLARPVIGQLKKAVDSPDLINVSLRNDIYYQQAGFWFCVGNFREAQSWISKILQDEDAPKENPARYRFARLMQLIVLLELEEFGQIENLLPATRKFIRRKGGGFRIEEAILEFISGFVRSREFHTAKFRKEKFSHLKKKLNRIAKDKNEAPSLRIFDYIKWIDAKIENKTMSGITQ